MKKLRNAFIKKILVILSIVVIAFVGFQQFSIWDASDPADDHSVVNDLLLPLTPTVSDLQAYQALSSSHVQIVDVRPAQEYEAGHIVGATSIPEETLYEVIPQTFKDKSQIIYLYCNTGHQGAVSTRLLRVMGYGNAFSIQGGIDAWKAAGYATSN